MSGGIGQNGSSFIMVSLSPQLLVAGALRTDLIAASIYDEYSIGPSTLLICTRHCFTMTNMIQVCGNFH